MRIRSVSAIVVCLLTTACAGMPNPLSPSGSSDADLTVTIDGQCLVAKRIGSADVYIDGVFQAEVRSGSSTTKRVEVGVHHVEAASYYPNGQALKWGPEQVTVPKGGFTELFHC